MTAAPLSTLCVFLLATFSWAELAYSQDFASRFSVIDAVEYVASDSLEPPRESAGWSSLSLPLGSRLGNSEGSSRVIWMRFDLSKPEDNLLYSLYFHRYNLSLDVFFNQQKIGGDTHKPNRHTTSWNHPHLVNIQTANWDDEINTVHIRFQASYLGGSFVPVVFGQTDLLTALWEDTRFKRIGVNSWLQLIGILVTALASILWFSRRHDSTYLLLAGMAASWTVLTTHMVVYYNIFSYQYWLPIVHLAMHTFTLLFFNLLAKLNRLENPLLSKLMLAWFAVSLVWNQFGPFVYWWMGTYTLHAVGNLFIVYQLARIVHKALFTRERLAIAISITVLGQISFFLHDYFMILLGGSEQWETAIYFTQFAFPLLLIVFAGILLERFRSALSLAENLNKELEAKVEASRQVIEQSYAQNRQLELDQATEKERIAIYRDLHDDVGSKLLSIVHAGPGSKLGDLARGALESLRSAVSKANSEKQLLKDLLSTIAEESLLRLEGSGHRVVWNQNADLPNPMLSADKVFNINQVFRELVSNVIRHANADLVTVKHSAAGGKWQFVLEDNGVGLSSSNIPGNGLNNVSQRISEIGGTITWQETQGSGVSVTVEIPL